jgi:hypothetical protein
MKVPERYDRRMFRKDTRIDNLYLMENSPELGYMFNLQAKSFMFPQEFIKWLDYS